MLRRFIQHLMMLLFIMGYLGGIGEASGLISGQSLNNSDSATVVYPGEVAPIMSFKNLDGTFKTIEFRNKPTILLFWQFDRGPIERAMPQLQKFFNNNKNKVNFYTISNEQERESIDQIFSYHNYNFPALLLEAPLDFLRYTKALPTLVIIDSSGIVRYNGSSFVDADSLERFIDSLQQGNVESLPTLLACPELKPVVQTIPVQLGSVAPICEFLTLEGKTVKLEFKDKTTVLFFWSSFTEGAITKSMPQLQEFYNRNRGKVNFSTIFISVHRNRAKQILLQQGYDIPTLVDKYPQVFANFTKVIQDTIVIDKNGIVRYNSSGFLTVEQLEQIIAAIDDQ